MVDILLAFIHILATIIVMLGTLTTGYGILFVAIAIFLLFFTFVIMPSI